MVNPTSPAQTMGRNAVVEEMLTRSKWPCKSKKQPSVQKGEDWVREGLTSGRPLLGPLRVYTETAPVEERSVLPSAISIQLIL